MNWTFLLTLYGTAPDGDNPITRYLAESAAQVLIGSPEDSLGYHLYEGEVPATVAKTPTLPFGFYVFSDTMPDEMVVSNRGKTYFNYFTGRLANDTPQREVLNRMLNISRGGPAPSGVNYTRLIHDRVLSSLHGKFSALVAELGPQPSFIFRSQKLPFKVWLLSYAGVYYMLVSNDEQTADRLEEQIISGANVHKETYFQQNLEVPCDSTLVFRPGYAIPKFRDRMRTFTDKGGRRLQICNYFRRFVLRQCIT